jgi:hypothetical protein
MKPRHCAKGAFSPPASRRRLCVTLTEYIFESMYNSYVESDDRFALAPLKDREKNRREKIFSLMGECSLVAFAKS